MIAGNRPYTQEQLINCGLTVISNNHGFEIALINWHRLPLFAQTWTAFKTHFTTARKYLRKFRGETMRLAGFHQANMMVQNLDSVRHEVLAEVRQVQNVVIDAIANNSQVVDENIPPPKIQTANTVMTNPEISGLLTLITNFTMTVQDLKWSVNIGCDGRGNGGHGYSGRGCGRGGCGGRGGCNQNNNKMFSCHPR